MTEGTDTDPDMKALRRPRPVLSVNLTWRQIAIVASVLGTPGGFALYKSKGAEDRAGAVAGQNTAITATATEAKASALETYATYRKEQLADRAELTRQGKAINGVVDDVAIIKAALALVLPGKARARLLARQPAAKVQPVPRAPLPVAPAAKATPPASAATVAAPEPSSVPPDPQLKGPTP